MYPSRSEGGKFVDHGERENQGDRFWIREGEWYYHLKQGVVPEADEMLKIAARDDAEMKRMSYCGTDVSSRLCTHKTSAESLSRVTCRPRFCWVSTLTREQIYFLLV